MRFALLTLNHLLHEHEDPCMWRRDTAPGQSALIGSNQAQPGPDQEPSCHDIVALLDNEIGGIIDSLDTEGTIELPLEMLQPKSLPIRVTPLRTTATGFVFPEANHQPVVQTPPKRVPTSNANESWRR